MATGLVTHPDCLEHRPGTGHPERPDRLRAVLRGVEESGVAAELDRVDAPLAPRDLVERVHDEVYVRDVQEASAHGPRALDADTAVSERSWRAALLAAGGTVEAAHRVRSGEWRNAFVAVRPPGHHAERARAMGFCLFDNVAIAARALRDEGVARVAILDWDVHHGNGTQHLFEEDPTVFYASLHQWPLYPGTGAAEERGSGDGEGATLNVPMPPGAGNSAWIAALEGAVLPALESFRPEIVLVSAGFDAHRSDPLAAQELDEEGFREMTRLVLELAASTCGGRLVSVLEGGYDLDALAASARAHVEELAAAG